MGAQKRGVVRKQEFFAKINELFGQYPKVLVVSADHVGSNHMQQIRVALRGHGELLMGKNTMMRKAIRSYAASNPQIEALLPSVKLNVGLIFTNGELSELKNLIAENRVGAPAKAGVIAPIDVIVPAGDTGMEPTQTSFLQALNIASKINRGQIQIINDVHLITKGQKVGPSEATLLLKLGIRPFSYGLEATVAFDDGFAFPASVLDLSDDDLLERFQAGIRSMAAISLATGVPSAPAIPHIIINSYKKLLALSVASDYTYEGSKDIKALLDDPEALAAAQSAAASATPAAAEEEKEEEPEEESDDDMGFGLFD